MLNFSDVLWRRRWVVAAVLAITLLLSPVILSLLHPTYQAEADIALIQDESGRAPVVLPADLPVDRDQHRRACSASRTS